MKVQVKQEHIDRGCRRQGDACPVFLAMVDAGIPVTHVTTWSWTTSPAAGAASSFELRELPHEAIAFVLLFDDKKPVHPFEFEVAYEV